MEGLGGRMEGLGGWMEGLGAWRWLPARFGATSASLSARGRGAPHGSRDAGMVPGLQVFLILDLCSGERQKKNVRSFRLKAFLFFLCFLFFRASCGFPCWKVFGDAPDFWWL